MGPSNATRKRSLTLTALLILAVPVVGTGVRAAPAVLAGVKTSELGNGLTRVEIKTSARPTFTTWKLDRPARVVVEISGVAPGSVDVPFEADTFAVSAVSVNKLEDDGGVRTRVVLTLRRQADYQVRAEGQTVVIDVTPWDKPAVGVAPVSSNAGELREAREAVELAEARARKAELELERLTATTRKLAEEKATLEQSRASAESAQQDAERTAAALAKQAKTLETRERVGTDRAQVARDKLELSRRREDAERARVAAEAALRRLEKEKQALERRRAESEQARLAAAELSRRLSDDRSAAERARAEAEATRTRAVEAEKRARQLLADAEAAQRDAEGRTRDASQSNAESTRRLQEARRETEEARRAAQQARQQLLTVEQEKQRLQQEKALLEKQQRELAKVADEAVKVETEAHRAGLRAAEVQKALSELEAERARVEADKQVLARRQAEQAEQARQIEADKQALAKQEAEQKARLAALTQAERALEERARAMSDKRGATAGEPSVVKVRLARPAPAAPGRSVTLRVPSQVSRIDFVDEPSRSSVIIDLDEPAQFSIEKSGGRRLTLRLHHADMPRGLERSLDATEYLGPVRIISSYRDSKSREVLVDVDLAESVPNRVRTDGARIYWDFTKPRHGSAATFAPEPGVERGRARFRVAAFATSPLPFLYAQNSERRPARTKRYTGRRIDLDFKGADIHNILRLLSDVGNVNIVTSDEVKGEVTIKMRDVPWDQALDVVLRAKNLGQVREGNLIRVAPMQVLEKELEQEIQRQKQAVEVAPTETRLIGVSYAEATELQERAKDLLSPRGKISVDDRTNNLIVSDVSKNLGLVEELVRNLDTQTSQVVIEARIVEARSTFVRQLGIQWGGTGFMDAEHGNPTGLVFPNAIGIGGGATDAQTPVQGLVPNPRSGVAASQSPNFAVNLPAPAGTGAGGALGLTLGSLAGAFNLNVRLSALESTGQVRILSSPRISTMDNVEASIEQGVAIPISVVSAQGVQTVFVDAKLNLTVKPHVTNEGTVILKVNVTRNEPDFVNTGARGDPTILKKEAKTTMLVRDGDTAVIGGIYQRNSGLSNAKVPFFADIPIIGYLFRNRRENDDRTEFLVFITPRIANRTRAMAR